MKNLKRILAFTAALTICFSAGVFDMSQKNISAADVAYTEIDDYTELSDILPQSYEEAAAFAEKYGEVSVHYGYIVYCGKDGGSTGYRPIFLQEGSTRIFEIESHTLSPQPLKPGSESYELKVYQPEGEGVVDCSWSLVHMYDKDNKLSEVKKYFSADEKHQLSEITEDEYTEEYSAYEPFEKEFTAEKFTFKNNAVNAKMSVAVSGNMDYDIKRSGDTIEIIPKEYGVYVVSVEEKYVERYKVNGITYTYTYPVINNYVLERIGDNVQLTAEGTASLYRQDIVDKIVSGEQPENENNVTFYNIESYLDGGSYYAFTHCYVDSNISSYRTDNYITTIISPDNIESYFVISAGNYSDYMPIMMNENASCAEFLGSMESSSSTDPSMSQTTPDITYVYRYKATSNGKTTIKVGANSYALVVKDGRFRMDKGNDISAEIYEMLPKTLKTYQAFREKYGDVSVHGNYIIYCDDINPSTGEELKMEQVGNGRIEEAMSYEIPNETDMDGAAIHTVTVYQPVTSGKVKVTWETGQPWNWENSKVIREEKYFEIGDDLTIREITKSEFKPFVEGDANGDGVLSVADVAMVGKFLLGKSKELTCWENVDLCKDGKIDVYDFCLMKKALLETEINDVDAMNF